MDTIITHYLAFELRLPEYQPPYEICGMAQWLVPK